MRKILKLRVDGTRAGVSLFIGLILVSLITVFTTVVANVVISSIQQSSNVNRANEAFFGAEGALEEGLKVNRENGAGFTLDTPATLNLGGSSVDGSDNAAGGTAGQTSCPSGKTYEQCMEACNPNNQTPYPNCDYCLYCPNAPSGIQSSVTPNVKAQYEIQGRVPAGLVYAVGTKYVGKYNIPTPGTGNVGQFCDTLDPPISKDEKHLNYPVKGSVELFELADPSEHPCNWNKLKVGETITIPLYFIDDAGEAVPFLNATTMSSASMIVRMRTPCKDGHDVCNANARFSLANQSNDSRVTEPAPYNDPVVSWQIVTEKTATGTPSPGTIEPSYVLSAISDFENPDDVELKAEMSTVILESKINEAKTDNTNQFKVFGLTDSTSFGLDVNKCKGTIKQFLLAQSPCWEGKSINKPVLKLSVIGNLITPDYNVADQGGVSGTNISTVKLPYLEYQIITSAFAGGTAPTNSVQTITAEGYSGTFKQVLEVKQPQSGGLLEYVIQQ